MTERNHNIGRHSLGGFSLPADGRREARSCGRALATRGGGRPRFTISPGMTISERLNAEAVRDATGAGGRAGVSVPRTVTAQRSGIHAKRGTIRRALSLSPMLETYHRHIVRGEQRSLPSLLAAAGAHEAAIYPFWLWTKPCDRQNCRRREGSRVPHPRRADADEPGFTFTHQPQQENDNG